MNDAHPLVAAIAAAATKFTAKRSPTRQGLEGWYPYYAGYTEQFAEGIIAAASDGRRLRILDPWNGSGTTTRAATMLGHYAVGFDINPVATLVASAKLANHDDATHVLGLARRLATSSPCTPPDKSDPLLCWVGPAVASRYRAIEQRIVAELATDEHGARLDPCTSTLPPLAAFLLLSLMRSARGLASIKPGSNPTWTRPGETLLRNQGRQLEKAWLNQIGEMAGDLTLHASVLNHVGTGSIQLGSSTDLPLETESFDLVVTSPPYCTRIDYAMGAAFELAALGLKDDSEAHRALRVKAMGTPLCRNREPQPPPSGWTKSIKATLQKIRSHPSKASGTYYYKTYFQYFDDCQASLKEIKRVLSKGGAAALVVQSSYYKDIYVDLPNLYVDCAKELGLHASIGSTVTVRKTLAQINSNSRKYRPSKEYEESTVIISH